MAILAGARPLDPHPRRHPADLAWGFVERAEQIGGSGGGEDASRAREG